jgi:hypothetical protein
MNSFKIISTDYLRSSRTIETVLISNSTTEKKIWIYNYEGWFFRVFENLLDMMKFFDNTFEPKICFENEIELDKYLETVQL